MSAGQPNWQKLYEMGKLPKSARNKVAFLPLIDELEKRMEEIEHGVCGDCHKKLFSGKAAKNDLRDNAATVQCEEDGCDFKATGRTEAMAKNHLRLHAKTHK